MQLRLHDVDDAFALVGSVIAKSGLELRWHERDDLEAWLVGTAWELSLKFEPGRSSVGFSTYATHILKRRIIDWQRRDGRRTRWVFRDRVYEKPRVELVSLDGLDELVPSSSGDLEAGRDEAYRGLVAGRDRFRARDIATIRSRRAR